MNCETKFILTMVTTTHPICPISNGKGSLEDIALKEPFKDVIGVEKIKMI